MSIEWPSLQSPVITPDAPTSAPGPAAGQRFSELLQTLGSQLERGEALVERATQGGAAHLDASELIALQAGIYRYTEAVELSAKFVDRAQNAVRTTLESGGR